MKDGRGDRLRIRALLILALAAASAAFPLAAAEAQWRLGLQGGLTMSTLGGSFVDDADPALGGSFGVGIERRLGSEWTLRAEPGLVQRGASRLPVDSEIVDFRLVYLEAPVTVSRMLSFPGGEWRIGPYVGAALAWLSSCGVRPRGASQYTGCGASTPGGEAARIEPTLPVGLVLRHRYPGGSRLSLDIRYSRSLASVLSPDDLAARSHGIQLLFGFTLPLGEAEAERGEG